MARVLFCCELGTGYGHVSALLPLALAMQRRGHEAVFVLNDLARAEGVLAAHGIRAFQCPLWTSRVGGLPPIRNYTDIMLRHGFLDHQGLRGVARAWRNLVDLLNPGLMVLDHSPVALFATRGMNIARVRFGTGFCCPPLLTPMPQLAWWEQRADPFDAVGERNAVHVANQAGVDLGLARVASVAEILSAEDEILCTFAELDHYDARAQGRFCGPVLDGSAGVSVLWPAGVGPCAFVYVRSEYPYVEPLVRSLVALGCKAVLHVPGLAPAAAAHMSTPRVVFSAAAVRMDEVLAHADFVVCHGGSGTTHTVLMAGKPLLLLPTQTEQIMQARRIAALGAAIMIAPTPTTPVFTKALERVMHGGTLLSSAAAFAASHKDHNVLACVENLGARCEALL